MDPGKRSENKRNPRENASLLSIILFWFTTPILRKGKKDGLEESDIYRILPKFNSIQLGNDLESRWYNKNGKVIGDKLNGQESIFKCLVKYYGCYYMFLGVIQLFMRTGILFLQPRALSKFVAYFKENQTDVTKQDALRYGFLLILINIIICIYNHNYQQMIMEYSIKVRTSLCALIYRKALKLRPGTFADGPMGKVVTLVTKDAFSIDGALQFMNDIWVSIAQTIVVTIILYNKIGYSVFGGIGLFLMTVPLQAYFGRKCSQMRLIAAKKAEERFQLVKETFSAIKIVKMYKWEKYFEKIINDTRAKEASKLKIIYYLKAVILTIGGLTHKLAFFCTILIYTRLGNTADAEIVYFIQQCFVILRSCITTSIPMGINTQAELYAAMKRFQEFLSAPEVQPKSRAVSVQNPKVYLNNVFVEIGGNTVLKSVSINLEKGLLIVAGNMGGGKSCLLKTILNEYPISGGELWVNGTISYAPEESWLFPSTIRQNILFGQNYDETRYQEVLRVCDLKHDLNQFKERDNTIVGDSGVNLSKGQQARICLARAVYKNSDIYLLDDCLSALDAHVNKYIFQECIRGFLKDKLVILVNNNANNWGLVPSGSVIFLENGKTPDLQQQKEAMDKRITYYIDDDANLSYCDKENHLHLHEANVNNEDNATEDDQLLTKQSNVSPEDNLYHESQKKGKVLLQNYISYYRYSGGICVLVLTIFVFLACQIALSFSDKLISLWVNLEPNKTKLIIANKTETKEYADLNHQSESFMNIYILAILIGTALTLTRSVVNFYFCTRAGKKLHKVLIQALLKAKMVFFDTHYIGNIVNRVSKDFHTIDENIPFIIYEIFRSLFVVLGTLALIASVQKYLVLLAMVFLVILYLIQRYYIETGRSLRRLEAASRSPMIGYINASLDGLTAVRAFQQENVLKEEFDKHQNNFTSVNYMNLSTNRAFGFILDMSCTFFTATIIIYFMIFSESALAGDVGLAVSQAMQLTGLLQWAIKQATEMENTMTSVERVLEYAHAEPESETGTAIANWPKSNSIEFDNVSLVYEKTNERALKNIKFEVPGNCKIGILGRTGAGKSSIISTLFRLYDYEGTIRIDGVDISVLRLETLRSGLGIIPQDPTLFSGTIRSNIDPLNRYHDSDIWSALGKVQMKPVITSLDQQITDHGQSYSSGQRQLICLARALLCKNKIIILDEATAKMDIETDKVIQEVIKDNFADCTVLVIAHRLYSFKTADKVLVVQDGRIVEFDDSAKLLEDPNSLFNKMIQETGYF
ncbi:ATP-binding cassette sub-family C member 4-like [Rhynchophorus ferrugineus]|uniref:ATP-binding cassette sub-family C member 4-like n=1 Tax=Rhynchophorus ferrugineus TaxID=354439 RepID=UPI003FCDC715